MGAANGATVLSLLEFDMLWESERLPRRHAALDVPSPGVTYSERSALIEKAWDSLAARRLARGGRASGDLVDMLNVFAKPRTAVDVWMWADREIKGLAASVGSQGMLAVIDGDEVWLIPTKDDRLAESVVSVIGELQPGVGRSISMPHSTLVDADADARGDAQALVTSLEDRGIPLWQAQEVAGMLIGMTARGQFGAQRATRDGQVHRAERVVAFHDTDAGRYLFQLKTERDRRDWVTVTPADNQLLAQRVWELIDEA